MPDAEVARRIARSVAAVTGRREFLHIPKPDPELREWTADEDKLLGTRPDRETARQLNRTLSGVTHRRVRLRIAACRPGESQQDAPVGDTGLFPACAVRPFEIKP
jgi:hypothetical protein